MGWILSCFKEKIFRMTRYFILFKSPKAYKLLKNIFLYEKEKDES